MWEYQNPKVFLQKDTQQESDKKVKKYCTVDICYYDLNDEEILETFCEKELQKAS